MKTLTALILVLALATAPLRAQSEPKAGLVLCLLVLAVVVTAGTAVIYVYTHCDQVSNRTLVLERDHYDGNWLAIATNTVTVTTNRQAVFRDLMTDDMARYRVRDLK